jgi:hypothetical protein
MKILYGLLIVLVIVLFITYRYNREGFEGETPATAATAVTAPATAVAAAATAVAAQAKPERQCTTKTTTESTFVCAAGEYVSKVSYDGKTTTYTCCPVLTGPQGPDGLQGAQGLSGNIGPQGPQGVPGPRGMPGEKGPLGPQGIRGPRGKKGHKGKPGMVGPQGRPGIDARLDEKIVGKIGEDGSITQIGPQGPAGDIGPQGPVGEAGAAGMDYIKPNDNDKILEEVDYNVDSENVSDAVQRTINLVSLQRNAQNMISSLSDPDVYNQVCPITPSLAQGNEFNAKM